MNPARITRTLPARVGWSSPVLARGEAAARRCPPSPRAFRSPFSNVVAGIVYATALPFVGAVTTYADARTRAELAPEPEPSELPAEIELAIRSRVGRMIDSLRVSPGAQPGLAARSPEDTLGLESKEGARERRTELVDRLGALQERLFAEGSRSTLLVLQGLDASGKDGVIRSVFIGISPDEYLAAWDDVIGETSTEWAPWHVAPADRNWVESTAVAALLVDALERLDPRFPDAEPGIEGLTIT